VHWQPFTCCHLLLLVQLGLVYLGAVISVTVGVTGCRTGGPDQDGAS
jgi:hypothetical protein